MAVCVLDKDILSSATCGYSYNGVSRIYLANFEDVTEVTVTEGSVANITMAASKEFYEVQPAKESATYSDNVIYGERGGKIRQHVLGFALPGVPDADTLDALALGKYIAVVQLLDGNYYMLGHVMGMESSVENVTQGTDPTAFAGVEVEFNAYSQTPILPLGAEAIKVVTGTGTGA